MRRTIRRRSPRPLRRSNGWLRPRRWRRWRPARANARQRAEAARRLGLWLVARACWKHDAALEAGDRLAALALDAARRQTDPLWTLAMLREWGQVALNRGDRTAAERHWSSALDLVLASATPSKPSRSASTASRPHGPNRGASAPALSLERFEQAADLARLAVENGMIDLSLRAVCEALQGGPPVVPVVITATVRTAASPSSGQGNPAALDPAIPQVAERLKELDPLGQSQQVATGPWYETLREIVLPASRPREIFLYCEAHARAGRAQSPAAGTAVPPHECAVGRRLARLAVAAGRVDDLRQRIAARRGQPSATLSAEWLLALLAVADQDR